MWLFLQKLRSAKDVLYLVDSGIIAVRYVSARKEYLENIDIGEAEILTLAESGEYDYLITDDVRALPYIKSITKVKVLTSAFVIRLLYDLKLLSRDEALNSIKEISASRDWYLKQFHISILMITEAVAIFIKVAS